jgi:CAAX prenyl protease-like protein
VLRSPAVPYVAPFFAFLGYLALRQAFPIPALADQALCVGLMTALLFFVSCPVLDFRVRNPLGTVLLGVAVFVLWIGPDALFPGYRQHWLFSNSLLGTPKAGLDEAARGSALVLILRSARAALIVPVVEELFWRGWLMRWLILPDFKKVPLGAWSARAFWIVAVMFSSEHGSYWEVGLAAGVLYNLWIVRTKSLGDLIAAHGVTNACLSAYVVFGGHWEYW